MWSTVDFSSCMSAYTMTVSFDDSRSPNDQESVVVPHEDPTGPYSETTTLIDASRLLYT